MKTRSEQPGVFDREHETAQQRHVEAVLRLDELRTGGDLLRQPACAVLDRCDVGILGGAEQDAWGERDPATALEAMLVAHAARDLQQRDGVEIEHGLGLRMIAGLHAVAGQAQHIADAHRGAAQDVALDGDAVPVATGNLHDGCVTDPRQQRADREARHVTVRAAAVRRIDRVDVAFEHARAAIDLFRIGRIRRRELGRDRERPRAQHALETPG